ARSRGRAMQQLWRATRRGRGDRNGLRIGAGRTARNCRAENGSADSPGDCFCRLERRTSRVDHSGTSRVGNARRQEGEGRSSRVRFARSRRRDEFGARPVVDSGQRHDGSRGFGLARLAACLSSVRPQREFETMSSFATYLVGFLILIGGLGFAAYLLNVPTMWIGVGVVILIGIGVLSATSRTKMRDPAAPTATTRPPSSPNA